MRSAFLGKAYPWLLPTIVTLLLVLSYVGAERVRRNTPEGKFNRIQLGMVRERVHEILGVGNNPPGLLAIWVLDDRRITVQFDDKNQVRYKSLECVIDDPGCVLPLDWGKPSP